ncbi:GatB/YqeY domain-containing protein [Patescibacteria group bacterium]|nr:GatB/YqeY domain-containing protein [Patescibacteria group bacterium]MCL5010109.1 GatB/YqeY domain-containing protein [Patescibacteria group bacterium]
MPLKQKLQENLRQSILARKTLETSVLRMLISAIRYFEIQKGGAGYEASDADILSVIQKEVKQRKDSIGQFQKGSRWDLAKKEAEELEILKTYLPEQINEEEIKKLVVETISETKAKGLRDMGKVMAIVMAKIKGKSDGSLVSKIVKESLPL